MRLTLEAKIREKTGKNFAKKLRKEGKIPGTVYGALEQPISIWVEEKRLNEVINKLRGRLLLVDLKMGKEKFPSLIKSLQRDSLSDRFIHVDFIHLHKGESIHANVPVILKGEPVGLKKGGILDHNLYEIEVKGTLENLPHHIEVDVSELDVGESILVKDLNLKKVDILTHPETVIVSIIAPRGVEEVEEVTEEAEEGEEIAPEEEKKEEE